MIRLDKTTTVLQIVLTGSITTNQLQCTAFFYDIRARTKPDNSQYSGARSTVSTNNTTDVTLVSAPTNGIVRNIDSISIHNRDTASATVIVKIDDSGTEITLLQVTLAAKESLLYEGDGGWQVL